MVKKIKKVVENNVYMPIGERQIIILDNILEELKKLNKAIFKLEGKLHA